MTAQRQQEGPGQLRIGTSGWVYRHWLDRFYPPKMPSDEQLPFYAREFDSVEVNYSFYRLPPRSVFETWREQVPADFLFAVKASRYLTHLKKLKEPEEPLRRLMESASGLGAKLGPLLFQFAPNWHADVSRLRAFLGALDAYPGIRSTFEFRHTSWFVPEVYSLLERAGAALCIAVRKDEPLNLRLTAPWTYIRVHGGQHGIGLTDAEVRTWAERIQQFRGDSIDTYIYFNNDPDGWAIENARLLRSLVSTAGGNCDTVGPSRASPPTRARGNPSPGG